MNQYQYGPPGRVLLLRALPVRMYIIKMCTAHNSDSTDRAARGSIYDPIARGKHSTVYKGRKKQSIMYFAIKSVDKCQKPRVLQEVRLLPWRPANSIRPGVADRPSAALAGPHAAHLGSRQHPQVLCLVCAPPAAAAPLSTRASCA